MRPGKSFNSNTPVLAALIQHHGGVPKVLGIARDTPKSVSQKLSKAATADVVLTSGGVSKGDFDLIRLMIGESGKVLFNRIGMGPGASFSFGTLGQKQTPIFALAGPPTGCLINFETLVRPALRKMLGHNELRHRVVEAEALDSAVNKAPFNHVRWTKLVRNETGYTVRFEVGEDSGMLPSLSHANSLTILNRGTNVKAGDKIQVLPLDWVE